MKSGVMSKTGTPVNKSTPPPDPSREAFRAYRDRILREDAKLATSDITRRQTTNAPTYLYNALSSRCKQCGIRFPDSSLGKKEIEEHLDMHFRQNRKVNQSTGRGHSRSWFVGVEVSLIFITIDISLIVSCRIGFTMLKERVAQMGLVR